MNKQEGFKTEAAKVHFYSELKVGKFGETERPGFYLSHSNGEWHMVTPCPGLVIPSREAALSAGAHATPHRNQDSS